MVEPSAAAPGVPGQPAARGAETEASGGAEARDSARAMAREALELMHEERWEEAHSLLGRAYALVPAPTVALLDGKALERLGRLIEASERFEAAARTPLPEDAPDAFHEAAKEAGAELERLASRIPTLTVVLRGDAARLGSTQVRVDDERIAPSRVGTPHPIDPGEHVVALTLDGELAMEDHVLVEEGEAKQIVLGAESRRAPPDEPGDSGRTLAPAWGWGALGLGAAGLTAGVAAGSVMLSARSTLDESCTPVCPPRLRDELSRFRSARTASAVGYVVGAVGVGTGVTLLLFSRSGRTRVSTDGRSIWIRGAF